MPLVTGCYLVVKSGLVDINPPGHLHFKRGDSHQLSPTALIPSGNIKEGDDTVPPTPGVARTNLQAKGNCPQGKFWNS